MWGGGAMRLAAVTAAVAASACMADSLPPVVDDEQGSGESPSQAHESLAESLVGVTPLTVVGSGHDARGSLIRVEASRKGRDELATGSLREVELAVLGGYIDVRALDGDAAAIRDLVIDIDDVSLPEGIVSPDVRFTGVHARIARPESFEMTWGERGERAEAIVSLDLIVDWGVSVDGGKMHPLAPVNIKNLEMVLELSRGERGGIEAQLAGFRDGVFYEWGGVVELRGLALDVRAGDVQH